MVEVELRQCGQGTQNNIPYYTACRDSHMERGLPAGVSWTGGVRFC